jgi:hypothetical protein
VAFKKRSENNFANRCLHHHVFTTSLVVEIVHHLNLQILPAEARSPFHIIIAEKIESVKLPINDKFLGNDAEYRRVSPFISDKQSLNQKSS